METIVPDERVSPGVPGRAWRDMPYAWGGAAGRASLRVSPEDFKVTELAVTGPSGQGEHAWLWVRKRDANTEWVARRLAQHAGVPVSAVGYAGLKDRRAVTEQGFSVHLPGREGPDWSALDDDAFEIVRADRHSRKLRRGALRGNRFELVLRDLEVDAGLLEQRLRQLREGGVPNAFGSQRFGHGGRNLDEAQRLFSGRARRLPRHKRGLYLSAARSALFNLVLAARIEAGNWNQALPGDALQLDGRSGCFVAGEPDDEVLCRVESGEVHPTGPLWGRGDLLPTGGARAFERQCLAPFERWCEGLERAGLEQARRALRVRVSDLEWTPLDDAGLRLRFSLPAGAYATSVVRELVDVETPGD